MKKLSIVIILLFLVACSTETMTDANTKPDIALVVTKDKTALIEWHSDTMDRGNHEYETSAHSKLVIDLDYKDVNRGDVIYYKTPSVVLNRYPKSPKDYIGRVVGLPGETVEIKEGQVFIDGKRLETFYAKATRHGMDEEEYFEKVDSSHIENEASTRKYFATNMSSVTVSEDTLFVLVDQWWRGTDSREFGGLPLDNVKGKVLGYVKK